MLSIWKAVILSVALIELSQCVAVPKTREFYLERANNILDSNLLIDGHNDWPYMLRYNFPDKYDTVDFDNLTQYVGSITANNGLTHTDVTRLKLGKVGGFFWVAYVSCDSLAKDAVMKHLDQIDLIRIVTEKRSDVFKFVSNTNDIKEAFKNGKIASLIGVESAHAIDSSLGVLRMFYELGARYMTLTHNCNVPWATQNQIDRLANASAYGGLTEFGKKVIAEMNRLGMLIDLSHTSYQTQLDTLAVTKAPVIYSHSSVWAICNHTRNVRDDVLLKLKENKGIIMLNFLGSFVNCDKSIETNIDQVVGHFNHVKKLIGVDHIGFGSDYDGMDEPPKGLEDVSKFPDLFAKLLQDGWKEDELIKIAGGNLLRVFSDVEKYAKSVSDMQPIDDFVPAKDVDDSFKNCRTSF